MSTQTDRVAGIERDIVERFLETFKDLYGRADEANYFLELKGAVAGINIAITNQRDALSHLVTVLNNPNWDRDQKIQQLHNAEEHLRRAILEPYEKAVAVQYERLLVALEQYKVLVLGNTTLSRAFPDAPSLQQIKDRLSSVNLLREEGRRAKLLNQVTPAWEDGVRGLATAFQQLEALEAQLDTFIVKARSELKTVPSSDRRRATILAFCAFGGGLVGWLALSLLSRIFF